MGLSDSEMLAEILLRMGGLETRMGGLETRIDGLEKSQRKLEESHQRLERMVEGQQAWFQNLGQKVESLSKTVDELKVQVGTELGDLRELIENISDDNKIHRRAIAGLSDQVEQLDERIRPLELPRTP
ncbi:MAG: hypothetical protein HY901_02015 [Deltaproteobacteria bacterium]|nr:hypothetical protein [Deltaproteobacteria bacterium]